MIYEFRLPLINPHMSAATVECFHVAPGEALKMGAKLLDVSVDLGNAFAQECPPVSFYRFVLREAAYFRDFKVVPGQLCPVNDLIALFSTEAEESLDAPVARGIRLALAGIMHHDGMWTGGDH